MESTIQVPALEPRIQGRSVPFRLEGVGSRGNFSCLEVSVQCGGLLSRTCLFYWGCSAAAWRDPGSYQDALAFPILRMISRIHRG